MFPSVLMIASNCCQAASVKGQIFSWGLLSERQFGPPFATTAARRKHLIFSGTSASQIGHPRPRSDSESSSGEVFSGQVTRVAADAKPPQATFAKRGANSFNVKM